MMTTMMEQKVPWVCTEGDFTSLARGWERTAEQRAHKSCDLSVPWVQICLTRWGGISFYFICCITLKLITGDKAQRNRLVCSVRPQERNESSLSVVEQVCWLTRKAPRKNPFNEDLQELLYRAIMPLTVLWSQKLNLLFQWDKNKAKCKITIKVSY